MVLFALLLFALAASVHGQAVSVGDVTVTEGNGGTVAATVTLTQAGTPTDGSVTLTATAGTATAGVDFVVFSGSVSFSGGATTATATVDVLGDTSTELDETVALAISAPVGVTIDTASATLTIADDDVVFTGTDVTVAEAGTATVTVSLARASLLATSIDWTTADGTAVAGVDYTADSGTLAFAAGETSKTFDVVTLADTLVESDLETIVVNFSSEVNAKTGTAAVAVSVQNDDIASVTVADEAAGEGDGTVTLTVSLSAAANADIVIDYSTSDGTAEAGSDYTAASGSLTFSAGQTSKTFDVTLLTDNTSETTTETFNVALALNSGTPEHTIADGSAVVTVTNIDQADVSIADIAYTEGASGGLATLTVSLSKAADADIAVTYTTGDGSALAGSDYTSTTGTATVTQGQTSTTFTVAVANDGIAETTQTFDVNLSGLTTTADAAFADNSATVTVTNVDTAIVSIADVTADESDATVTVTVAMSPAADAPVTVDFAMAAVSAATPADFTAATGTVTFGTGSQSETIVITLSTDSLAEPNLETFQVNLSNLGGTPDSSIGDAQAIVSITNVDTAAISVADVGGTEGDGTITVTVTMTPAATETVSVDYTTSDGTALAGAEYTAVSGTLTFTAGQTSKTVDVTIADDGIASAPTKAFTFVLSNVVTTVDFTLSDASATVTITEDETASITVADASGAETDGSIDVVVSMTPAADDTVTVAYTTADGTADTGDYTTTAGTLTFAAGETSKTISVPVTADSLAEVATETFLLQLSGEAGTPQKSLDDASATISLTSADSASISIADASGAENDGTIVVTVTMAPAADSAITVDFATDDGTATAGNEYTTQSGTLSFAAGETSKTISLAVINDAIASLPSSALVIDLTNPTGTAIHSITDAQATVTIVSDDTASITIADAGATEGDGTITVTVNMDIAAASSVTVSYATADGSAEDGSDYTAVAGTVVYAIGESGPKTFTVAIAADGVAEPATETFTVGLSGLTTTSDASIDDASGTMTVTNADTASLSVAANGATEAAGSIVVTVSIDMATQTGVTVTYTTSNGAALAGSDYTAASNTLTWAAGDAADKTFSVAVAGDGIAESTTEDFTVTLSLDTSASETTIGTASASMTITNSDTASITVADEVYDENAGAAVVTISMTPAADSAVSVDYATSDAGATAGADYTATSGTVTFAAGETSKTVSIPITNDGIAELATEDITFTLSNVVATADVSLDDATATVTINNIDTATMSVADITFGESDGTGLVTFHLSCAGDDTISADYASAAGTATDSVDYTTLAGTVTFAAGETSKTVALTIAHDLTDEGVSETLDVQLSNLVGNPISALGADGTVTITDDDIASASVADVTVNEDAGVATVTISLSTDTQADATVDLSTADITAVAGVDYTAIGAQTVTFTGGSTSETVDVTIAEDGIAEGTSEALTVTLTNAVTCVIGTASATVTIGDNDMSFSAADVVVNEAAGTATVTVTLSAVSLFATSVDYTTLDDGDAVVTTDYATTAATASFAAGEATKTFTVAIVGDAIDEVDEVFSIVLSNPVNGAVIAPSSSVTIVDDDTSTVELVAATFDESAGLVLVDVTLSTENSRTVTADWTTGDGTAIVVQDFEAGAATVSFAPGSVSETIGVTIVDGTVDELDEVFTITISNAVVGVIGTATVSFEITDNDDTFLDADNVVVGEEDGSAVAVSITLTGTADREISVDFATSDLDAVAGDDYVATTGTLVWAIGETGTKTATVDVVDDVIDEEVSEAFSVNLSGAVVAVIVTATGTTTVTDNDVAAFSLVDTTYSESAGSVVAAVVALSTVADHVVTVDYATQPGTAVPAVDYVAVSGTISIQPFDLVASIALGFADDAWVDGDKVFQLVLSNPSSAIGTGTSNVHVLDDEVDELVIGDIVVLEADGVVAVPVTLSAPFTTPVTVDYVAVSGTALEGDDFQAAVGTLTIPGGTTSISIVVSLVVDAVDEADEAFTVVISNAVGVTIGAQDTATVTLIDDAVSAAAGVTVSASTLSVRENGGTGTFSVVLGPSVPSSNVVVEFGLKSDARVSRSPAELTFRSSNYNVAQTVTVRGIDNNLNDNSVSYSLGIDLVSADGDYAALSPSPVAITLTNVAPKPTISVHTVGSGLFSSPLDVHLAEQATASLVIENRGNADLVLLDPPVVFTDEVNGASAAMFALNGVPSLTTLKPGNTSAIPLRFQPTAVGTHSVVATVQAATLSKRVTLQGQGFVERNLVVTVDGAAVASGDTVDLETLAVPTIDKVFTVVIANAGGAPLTVSALTIGGAHSTAFRIGGTAIELPLTLAADETREVLVVADVVEGERLRGSLQISSDDGETPEFLTTFTFIGFSAPKVVLRSGATVLNSETAPKPLVVGPVILGASALSLPLTVQNSGVGALEGFVFADTSDSGLLLPDAMATRDVVLSTDNVLTATYIVSFASNATAAFSRTTVVQVLSVDEPAQVLAEFSVDIVAVALELSSTPATAVEGDVVAVTASVPAALPFPADTAVTVPVALAADSVAGGRDYRTTPERLVFGGGISSVAVQVKIVNDSVEEDAEDLMLHFGTATRFAVQIAASDPVEAREIVEMETTASVTVAGSRPSTTISSEDLVDETDLGRGSVAVRVPAGATSRATNIRVVVIPERFDDYADPNFDVELPATVAGERGQRVRTAGLSFAVELDNDVVLDDTIFFTVSYDCVGSNALQNPENAQLVLFDTARETPAWVLASSLCETELAAPVVNTDECEIEFEICHLTQFALAEPVVDAVEAPSTGSGTGSGSGSGVDGGASNGGVVVAGGGSEADAADDDDSDDEGLDGNGLILMAVYILAGVLVAGLIVASVVVMRLRKKKADEARRARMEDEWGADLDAETMQTIRQQGAAGSPYGYVDTSRA